MRWLLFSIIPFFFLSAGSPRKERFFEGIITYKIEFAKGDPYFLPEFLDTAFGSREEYYFKEGYYKAKYFDSKGNLIFTRIYDRSRNRNYYIDPDKDSIRTDSAGVVKSNCTGIRTANTSKVLGHLCTGYGMNFWQETEQKVYQWSDTMYFGNVLKINPEWFAGYRDQDWFDLMKETRSLPLKRIQDGDMYKETATLVKIRRCKLDMKEFAVPDGRPLKYE
jgi:hypothetical protein